MPRQIKTKRSTGRNPSAAKGKTKERVPKSRAAKKKIQTVMREYKRGKLDIGRSKKPVKNRKQAIAIGLSEARKSAAKKRRKG